MVENYILDSFAHFGDGNTCLIMGRRKVRGEDGIIYWEFVFRPNDRIKSIYGLNDAIDVVSGTIVRKYPNTEVYVTDENPSHYRVWIFTDFDGNSTSVSRIDDDKDLQILNFQKKIATYELENAELHQMLRRTTASDEDVAHAESLIKRARSAASRKLRHEDAGDSDEEQEE